MKENKLTFKDENLTVDWIGFKFQNLDNFAQVKLAEYFFIVGFNPYRESGKLATSVKESIFAGFKNNFQVFFIDDAPYWEGTSIQFSVINATSFYSLIKRKLIDWKLFSLPQFLAVLI